MNPMHTLISIAMVSFAALSAAVIGGLLAYVELTRSQLSVRR
jgi:hypothetical protein